MNTYFTIRNKVSQVNRLLLIFAILLLGTACLQAQTKHTFQLADSVFLLDGKPFQMISGEMHCARIPRQYWRDRMRKAKAMGLNTIGTYVFWNAHEPTPGHFDFTGDNDIAGFVRMAKEEGLWVVMRPSPYVCAEWEFGGYPWWLLKDTSIKVRGQDPRFITAYRRYMQQLARQLVPLQITHGGNILMVQIENEYGGYGDDKAYLDLNRKIFREVGFDGVLFTCDPAKYLERGYLPGYLPAVNGVEDPKEIKRLVNQYHKGKGPYYMAEWYPGWFDVWGKPHEHRRPEAEAAKLDRILAAGISINMYMFHGGTTRGYMNGANMDEHKPYSPQTSSYDYDAPLDEAGHPTEKYYLFRKVIQNHLPAGRSLPPIPAEIPPIALPDIKFTGYAGLKNNLPQAVKSGRPLTFEELDQGYGYVLYRTYLPGSKKGVLKIDGLRDYAMVYLEGQQLGTLDRRLVQDSLALPATHPGVVLDILVENNGRINVGPYLRNNRKGILGKVTLAGQELIGWEQYRLPISSPAAIKFALKSPKQPGPTFYRAEFDLRKTGDTWLDLSSFGKGVAFLNGHHLGKYWSIGPQQTLYVPAVWLKTGRNQLVLFDEQAGRPHSISLIAHPIVNKLTNPILK